MNTVLRLAASHVGAMHRVLLRLALPLVMIWSVQPLLAIGDEIAVAGRVFNGYTRTRLPDKSFRPETFTFANGGRYDAPIAGDPIDKVTFVRVARELIAPLAKQGYVQSVDPRNTQLLIWVSWGTTMGSEDTSASPAFERVQESLASMNTALASARADLRADPAAAQATSVLRAADESTSSAMTSLFLEQKLRDMKDEKNAGILGFQTELWRAYTTFGTTASEDLLSELRANRYFVVLKAYDFQTAWKEKRRKLLWETRFSIRARRVDFFEQLPAMAAFAATYYGRPLDNLIRRPLPEVKIEYGRPQLINYEDQK